MAVVAAMMSTITTATTPPMMATVLSELDGVAMDILFPGRTGAVKKCDKKYGGSDNKASCTPFHSVQS